MYSQCRLFNFTTQFDNIIDFGKSELQNIVCTAWVLLRGYVLRGYVLRGYYCMGMYCMGITAWVSMSQHNRQSEKCAVVKVQN